MFGGETLSIKFFKTLNVYKNSTGTCLFYPDQKYATSYNHWTFLKVIKGKLVFNDYYYSKSTSSHQSCVREVLKTLKMKIHFTVFQRDSLSNGIQIDHLLERIELAKLKLSKKGLRQKTRKSIESDLEDTTKELKKIQKALKISVSRDLLKQVKERVLKNENSRLERQRRNSPKKSELSSEIKAELEDLGSVDLLSKMNDLDDLNTINL